MTTPFIALADDLSGAAETAAVLATARPTISGVSVVLHESTPTPGADIVVVDADLRETPRQDALPRAREIVASLAARDRLPSFVKVDSLLRGPVSALVTALVDSGRRVLVAPALPVLGRTTVEGRILVHGQPVASTGLLDLETSARGDLGETLDGHVTRVVSLHEVRGGVLREVRADDAGSALAVHLATLVDAGVVPLVDAETDADLDLLVAAVEGHGWTLVGSAGVAAAIGRQATPAPVESASPTERSVPAGPWSPTEPPASHRPVLVVVGSGSSAATAQLAALEAAGVPVLPLARDLLVRAGASDVGLELGHPDVVAAGEALRDATTVLTIADREVPSPAEARLLVTGLGRVAAAVAGACDLVLTGGETARSTLDLLGITRLDVEHVVEHGCVCSRASDGRSVVTRPGSFGGPENLVDVLAHLENHHSVTPSHRDAVPHRKAQIS